MQHYRVSIPIYSNKDLFVDHEFVKLGKENN